MSLFKKLFNSNGGKEAEAASTSPQTALAPVSTTPEVIGTSPLMKTPIYRQMTRLQKAILMYDPKDPRAVSRIRDAARESRGRSTGYGLQPVTYAGWVFKDGFKGLIEMVYPAAAPYSASSLFFMFSCADNLLYFSNLIHPHPELLENPVLKDYRHLNHEPDFPLIEPFRSMHTKGELKDLTLLQAFVRAPMSKTLGNIIKIFREHPPCAARIFDAAMEAGNLPLALGVLEEKTDSRRQMQAVHAVLHAQDPPPCLPLLSLPSAAFADLSPAEILRLADIVSSSLTLLRDMPAKARIFHFAFYPGRGEGLRELTRGLLMKGAVDAETVCSRDVQGMNIVQKICQAPAGHELLGSLLPFAEQNIPPGNLRVLLNERTAQGDAPVMQLVKKYTEDQKADIAISLAALLSRGTDPNTHDNAGMTPLDVLIQKNIVDGPVVSALLAAGGCYERFLSAPDMRAKRLEILGTLLEQVKNDTGAPDQQHTRRIPIKTL